MAASQGTLVGDFDVLESVKIHVAQLKPFDVIESIRNHIEQLKPLMPRQALVCMGEYPARILAKQSFIEETSGVTPIFIQKSGEHLLGQVSSIAELQTSLSIGDDVDTHFWFNVASYLAESEQFRVQLKSSTAGFHGALLFVSLWEGLGSALLPALISEFKVSNNTNSVALALLPSKSQPSDAHFNALASIGMCASSDAASVVLFGRDFVEEYLGVDRKGSRLEGSSVINYVLEMMLAREVFTQELSELSRAFNVKLYATLTVTGASFKVYGSFESMLYANSMNPALPFDLTSASVLFVLARVPLNLKDKLTRGRIEMETAKWSSGMPGIKSIYVSEPIYVDDPSDRVDAIVFVGGFDLTELVALLQRKAGKVKNETIKKGLVKEEMWEALVKSLA